MTLVPTFLLPLRLEAPPLFIEESYGRFTRRHSHSQQLRYEPEREFPHGHGDGAEGCLTRYDHDVGVGVAGILEVWSMIVGVSMSLVDMGGWSFRS